MKISLFMGFLIATITIHAQDRLFTYTYQSTVLNKGQKELEIWNTVRTGRDNFYTRLDHRTEYEIGLGSSWQTAFYLNLTSKTATMEENNTKFLETEYEISFSNEWKWKLADPVVNPLGIALYGEYTIGSREFELEGKLILDKQINRFLIAANAVYELELDPAISNNETEWEKEHKADLNVALACIFSPRFAITLENTFKNVFAEGGIEHSALYSGPGFSYAMEKFWINFTALPQVVSFKGEANSSLNLHEFEKIQLRLLFSYVF